MSVTQTLTVHSVHGGIVKADKAHEMDHYSVLVVLSDRMNRTRLDLHLSRAEDAAQFKAGQTVTLIVE